MENDKSIKAINKLIEINNDRIEGYKTASKETKENDLINLFSQFSQTSQRCKTELVNEVKKLGGKPIKGTKTSGKFFRKWMDVKAAITNRDRKAILSSCEFGEDNAISTYEDVLKNDSEYLNTAQITLIENQLSMIQADHNKVKNMLDMFVEHH